MSRPRTQRSNRVVAYAPSTQADGGVNVGLGLVPNLTGLHKFGRASDCDAGVATDIWDGADGTTSTDVWVAPTEARVHDIASSDANDTSAGTGARTVRVYGLTSWSTSETSEDVTLNGTSNVATSSSYVIVHRMKCMSFGSGKTNAGNITATAQTDATITAMVTAGYGQTLMCIYGLSSNDTLALQTIVCTGLKTSGSPTTHIEGTLLVNEDPGGDGGFLAKEVFLFSDSASWMRTLTPPSMFSGPAIIKLQVNADVNNSLVAGSFDGVLHTT